MADILQGDCRVVLGTLPAAHFQTCVTSPPYFGLRDYGVAGQIGLEASVDEYVTQMVAVFRGVWRVLRDDGTAWLNLGDSFAGGGNGGGGSFAIDGLRCGVHGTDKNKATRLGRRGTGGGVKPKDLIGIPWRVAFALQADGWYLRRDIIWAKPNPMPESVIDRPTSAHEYLFLLTKKPRYFYDSAAIREPMAESSVVRLAGDVESQAGSARAYGGEKVMKAVRRSDKQRGHSRRHDGFNDRWDAMNKAEQMAHGANARSVWTVATVPFPGSHFATMPPPPRRKVHQGRIEIRRCGAGPVRRRWHDGAGGGQVAARGNHHRTQPGLLRHGTAAHCRGPGRAVGFYC